MIDNVENFTGWQYLALIFVILTLIAICGLLGGRR